MLTLPNNNLLHWAIYPGEYIGSYVGIYSLNCPKNQSQVSYCMICYILFFVFVYNIQKLSQCVLPNKHTFLRTKQILPLSTAYWLSPSESEAEVKDWWILIRNASISCARNNTTQCKRASICGAHQLEAISERNAAPSAPSPTITKCPQNLRRLRSPSDH